MTAELSPLQQLAARYVAAFGDRARDEIAKAWSTLTLDEQAALTHAFRYWLRPKQRIEGEFSSHGFLTGRGFGKTFACCAHVVDSVIAGTATRIALCAQNGDMTAQVMVEGEDGLLAMSPPWFAAEFTKGRVEWPNGARAFCYTPEEPEAPRGENHDLAWLSEIRAWPAARRDECFKNIRFSLRIGRAALLWDTTPKRRNSMIRMLLSRAVKKPRRHRVIRGTMAENAANLAPDMIAELEDEFSGQSLAEERDGVFFDESDGALWKQEWIDANRRDVPARLARRIVAVDPAISMRAGTDATGIVELGLGLDQQVHVFADLSDRVAWEVWGALVVDRYLEGQCDCVVVERNRGGDAVAANLRACAKDRGIAVVVLDAKTAPRHQANVIYVREVIGRGTKEVRAQPVASLYERGRASHVPELERGSLEDQMTTWEPGPGAESPNALDALVHGVVELAGLRENNIDPRESFRGLDKAAAKLSSGHPRAGLANVGAGSKRRI